MTATETSAGLAPYLPRFVAEWARTQPDVGWREVEGSLVSVDLSGFTALSERLAAKGRAGTEELILVISGVFEGLIGIAERHGGDVLKFRGDALLILFDGDRHEVRACRASSDMQWFIESAGSTMSSVGPVELRMAAGVYSGPCHLFLVEGTHRELLLTGPATTATYRLEDASSAGEVLVSPATAAALDESWQRVEHEDGVLLERAPPNGGEPAAPERAADQAGVSLAEYVPKSLRAHLEYAQGEAEHRQATVAFLKFSGLDEAISAGEAAQVHAQLQELASVVGATCDAFDVTWLESDIDVDGGKLYLTAGAPASAGDDEERMLRAVRAIVDASAGPPIRAGINGGPVFAGDIGGSRRRTYAVMGDTVNLAARLVARAAPGEVLATGDVLERSRTQFATETQPLLMKGKERAVTAYKLGAVTGAREDERAAAMLPLVGRDEELATIREAIEAARLRQQQVVQLVGEPGIGKSRIIDELPTLALGFNPLRLTCERYTANVPFAPLRNALRSLAGITPEQPPEAAGAQLAPWVQAVMPDLAQWLPLLAIPFDATVPPTPETESLDPEFRRDRLHEALEQFLQRVFLMPTLFVLEDSHWADDSTAFFMRYLFAKPAMRPWLVVATRRPEGGSIVGPESPGHVLSLEPLTEAASAALALAAADQFALSEEALATVAERSGGNPLFVRELVAASREGGTPEELPESIERLMTARIDALEPSDRLLLRFASVIGARFELELLDSILGGELDATELDRWHRLGEFVLWDAADVLRFRHDLIRATAYEGLSFRRRREIHGRLADTLEQRPGSEAGVLSLHFFEAQRFDMAWQYAVAAGDAARSKYANVVAAELYERALAAAEELPELPRAEVARVAEALGDVSELFADYERAARAYSRALEAVAADVAARARLTSKQGVLHERSGRYGDALLVYEAGLATMDAAGADGALGERAKLERGIGAVHFRRADYEDAVRWCQLAAEHAEQAGDKSALAHALYILDHVYRELGREGGPELCARALALYEELGDFLGQSIVLNNLGIRAYYEGRWDEALDYYRRSREAKLRGGDVVRAASQISNEAEIRSDQGHLDEAHGLFTEALRTFRAAGYSLGTAFATANLGRVAARRRQFEEAQRLLDEARTAFVELSSQHFIAETDARRGEAFVLEGRYAEALEVAEAAREAARGEAAGGLQALIERQLGYAHHQRRDPAAARPHFEKSLRLAREQRAEYEVALSLRALAETGNADGAEAAKAESDEILERLGVVFVPNVPLP